MTIDELAVSRVGRHARFGFTSPRLEPTPGLLDRLPLAIYACDRAGRIVWFNARAAELWGRQPRIGDDTEKYWGWCTLHGDTRRLTRWNETPIAAVLGTGIAVRGVKGWIERPDGPPVEVMVHIDPVEDEDGTIIGALNCFQQIPVARRAADELQGGFDGAGGRFAATYQNAAVGIAEHEMTARKRAEEALARRAEEQAALYEFTAALQHCERADELYSRAMTAIVRALRCERASILLFDASGDMKFVAWRGLSDRYRQAVEGHSPWRPEERDPRPICIADIGSAELPQTLEQTIRAEGIAALAFIPIVADGRLLGKFMTYYDRPHVFTEPETDLALAIARQLGLALARARVEAARQHAERAAQQLVAIVESSHDAIVSKDLDGIIATWNKGAERLFGYTAEEVIGRPITILIPPDRLDEEPAILARIRSGQGVDHFETVRRRKDGSLIDISLTISPVRDGKGRIVGASKIARDITERKIADARLRDSERQLKDLLAAIPAAIYTTDAQGRITYFNEKAAELAGRAPTVGEDEWCVTWKLYWPDGTPMPPDQCPMAVALKEGRPVRSAEAIAERPDGTRVPFIPYPTPLRDASGAIVGAVNMLVDISERKQAESQQRILFNELNHRVKNNMQMLQSLLRLSERKTRNPEARQILGEASSRISAMTAAQQVLYGTTGATSFNAREFLNAVCDTARRTLSPRAFISCEAEEIELPNDVAMPLALVVNELVTNAVKHGVNASGEVNVRVGLSRREEGFLLVVEDDGPGFELQSARARGSGLQLAEGLVRQIRGRLELRTSPATRCTVQFSRGP